MLSAVALAAARLAASNRRSFAATARSPRALRERRGAPSEPDVEVRPLERYDALIA